jgi:hypothetical protein
MVTAFKRDSEVFSSDLELPAEGIRSDCVPWIKANLNAIYGPTIASTNRTARVSTDIAIYLMGTDYFAQDPYPYQIERYINNDDLGRVAARLVEDQSLDAGTVIFE